MTRLIIIAISAVMLSGCSVTRSDEMNNINGIEYITTSDGAEYVYTYTVVKNFNRNKMPLAACVAQNVNNDSVVFSGSAQGYIGLATGNYYRLESKSVAGGGETMKYADAGLVVANGISEYYTYSLGLPIKRYVKYTLTAKVGNDNVSYKFSDIKVAPESSGTNANLGFSTLGAWEGAGPVKVINTLSRKVDEITSCLRS